MIGVDEQSDGSIDPEILRCRQECSLSERISNKNWKIRKDAYEEIISQYASLTEDKIKNEICMKIF